MCIERKKKILIYTHTHTQQIKAIMNKKKEVKTKPLTSMQLFVKPLLTKRNGGVSHVCLIVSIYREGEGSRELRMLLEMRPSIQR